MRLLLALILLSLAAGCARQSFSIQKPAGLSQLITHRNSVAASLDQIDYTFSQRQGKLLVTIINSTGKPVTLTSKSSATDAAGRLTFFQNQSIPSGAEGHVAIPPPPSVDPNLRRPTAAEVPTNQPFEGGTYYDDRVVRSIENKTAEFVWSKETNITLTFVYGLGDEQHLTHSFVIRREE